MLSELSLSEVDRQSIAHLSQQHSQAHNSLNTLFSGSAVQVRSALDNGQEVEMSDVAGISAIARPFLDNLGAQDIVSTPDTLA